MTEFSWGAATDTGRVRSSNQDKYLGAAPVFVVADGMGGHKGGEIAAQMAIDEMAKAEDLVSLEELIEAVQRANWEIVHRSMLEPQLRGMGTTVVALVGMSVDGSERIGIANVGDSRLYLRTDDELTQLTEDHSLVETLVREGRLSREEADAHPQRNIVTRALGIDDKALIDSWELVPVPGDRYLLCTDGLFNEIEASTILDMLHTVDDPADAAAALVEAACEAGGSDNVTAMVVDVDGTDAPTGADEPAPPADRVLSTRKAIPDRPEIPELDEGAGSDLDAASARPRRVPLLTWRLGLFVAGVVVVLAVLVGTVVAYARSGYHIGTDGEEVVIYRGREGGVLWLDPTIEERLAITVAELAPDDLAAVNDGIEFDSLDEALLRGLELQLRSGLDETP